MSLTESQTSSIAGAWDHYAVAYQNAAHLPTDVVSYGPGIGAEAEYRLLGPLTGKRFLDLGCGGGQSAIAAAKQGAISTGLDISVEQLAFARRLAEQLEDVRVELKQGDLAELAFLRADTIDIVFSAMAFQYIPDLNRVFRQVHRVLKPQGMLVFSITHPASALTDRTARSETNQLSLEPEVVSIRRGYFDNAPIEEQHGDITLTEYRHTTTDIFMGLVRCGYRVDVMLEPEISGDSTIPQALIIRARKEA